LVFLLSGWNRPGRQVRNIPHRGRWGPIEL